MQIFKSYDLPKDYTGIWYCEEEKYTAWALNGKYHREDGPAVVYDDGTSYWYYENDRMHRIGGPAVKEKKFFWRCSFFILFVWKTYI